MKKVVVLTGAGISAESGISTFRDSDGLWEQYRVEDVATHEAWERNPKLVLDFYNARRKDVIKAQPNEAHKQLVRLEEKYDVHIITQNIDNLHERAGSSNVIHLHGDVTKCCSDRNLNVPYPIDGDTLAYGITAPDGGMMRPFIVFFNEPVPMMDPAMELCSQADYFIIVGTSLVVYPAAGLINFVPKSSPCYLVDPKEVSVSRNIKIYTEKAGTGVKKVVDELMSL
ncbi:MAG: NAD-dependent protein deacylase [Bacteroidales bacterium]|nr:NAD-dependent protein deacylase [Bacteroidales bacterium]